MSESRDDIIQVQPPPLTHLSKASAKRRLSDVLDWRSGAVATVVIAVVITAIVWQPQSTSVPEPQNVPAANATDPAPREVTTTDAMAPFASAQHELAREKAQEALAQFVEKQIFLENNMQVATWGAEELAAAMALAQSGDAEFQAERFDLSLQAYQDAVASLDDIIDQGNTLFEQHLASAEQYIAARSADAAVEACQQALIIKPEDPRAQALLQRAQLLPEIIGKLRTAKNHELGGRYQKALEVYAEIQQLDGQTTGLADLIASAAAAQAGDDLTGHISRGFAALERNQFEQARQAFKRALALDPGNDIAQAGLQQVAKENDLAVIRGYRKQAEQAITDEQWQSAIDTYQAVLKLDGNIQFALNGVKSARAHLRAQRLLEKISSEPQKLSSEKLYLDAKVILEDARELEYAGAQMIALVEEVTRLLEVYRDPVDVVLLSDNATNIVMSNVGQLGFFERKTLTLRPGQYTIRGSQAGCRDIYMSVEVLPGFGPLDLSCPEPINPK